MFVRDSNEEMSDADLYMNYGIHMGIMKQKDPLWTRTLATGRVIAEILGKYCNNDVKLWADSDATHMLAQRYLSERYSGNLPVKFKTIAKWADVAARDLSMVSFAACRLGKNATDKLLTSTVWYNRITQDAEKMYCWSRGFENMRMHTNTGRIRDAHERLRQGDLAIPIEEFHRDDAPFIEMLGVQHVYKISGVVILVYEDALFALDFSSTAQLHAVSKFWEGMFSYCANYRLCGTWEENRMLAALRTYKKWVAEQLDKVVDPEYLARSMKQSVALLQNKFHANGEVLDVGWERKDAKLREEIRNIMRIVPSWHDLLDSLPVNDRQRLDLANVYRKKKNK